LPFKFNLQRYTTGGKDPFKPERAAAVDLGSKISSGGGFSSIFPQPEWQKAAVDRQGLTIFHFKALTVFQGLGFRVYRV
jgi:subtilase family serine protease